MQYHVQGQGQSNIVFSSSISVADAIRAAIKLKADLKFSEVEVSFVDVPDRFLVLKKVMVQNV
jgi:hypothetical protein